MVTYMLLLSLVRILCICGELYVTNVSDSEYVFTLIANLVQRSPDESFLRITLI